MSYYTPKRNKPLGNLTKPEAQRSHCKKRAWQRYSLMLNDKDLFNIGELIRTGQSLRYKKKSNRIIFHTIKYDGEIINVAYDKKRNQLASILPPTQDF